MSCYLVIPRSPSNCLDVVTTLNHYVCKATNKAKGYETMNSYVLVHMARYQRSLLTYLVTYSLAITTYL